MSQNKRYYCHVCLSTVNNVVNMKCPNCQNDFLEELPSAPSPQTSPANNRGHPVIPPVPQWNQAPFLFGGDDDEEDEDDFEPQGAPWNGGNMGNLPPFTIQLNGGPGGAAGQNFLQQMMQMIFPGNVPTAQGAAQGGQAGQGPPPGPLPGGPVLMGPGGPISLQQLFGALVGRGPGQGSVQMGDYVLGENIDGLLSQLFHLSQPKGAPPASKEAKNNLKSFKVQADNIAKQTECPICKCDYEVDDQVKEMPCGHIYHPDCIDKWLDQRNICPMCRVEIATDDPDYEKQRLQRQQAQPQPQQNTASSSATTTSSSSTATAAPAAASSSATPAAAQSNPSTPAPTPSNNNSNNNNSSNSNSSSSMSAGMRVEPPD